MKNIFKGNPPPASSPTPPPLPPAPSPALSLTITPPPGQHRQTPSSEARVVMASIGQAFSSGKSTDSISSNMTSMMAYANTILRNNTLPQITKSYAPNEMASLLHDLQTRLGV